MSAAAGPLGGAAAGAADASGRLAFVRANTRLLRPPLAPEIALHLAEEPLPIWRMTEEELAAEGLPPPYWAFAWAGGQALARHLLDQPKLAAVRRALDFGAGSGIAGIAAALAGAARVEASEIDAFAGAAIAANAAANGVAITVRLEDMVGREEGWELVLAADVAYEREPALAIFPWLAHLARGGAQVLVGDPGRSYLPRERLRAVAEYSVPTTRALEDALIKRAWVWEIVD